MNQKNISRPLEMNFLENDEFLTDFLIVFIQMRLFSSKVPEK